MVWEGAEGGEWVGEDRWVVMVVVKGGVGGEIMIEVVLLTMIGEDEIKLRKRRRRRRSVSPLIIAQA